jgi:hypothetical protein
MSGTDSEEISMTNTPAKSNGGVMASMIAMSITTMGLISGMGYQYVAPIIGDVDTNANSISAIHAELDTRVDRLRVELVAVVDKAVAQINTDVHEIEAAMKVNDARDMETHGNKTHGVRIEFLEAALRGIKAQVRLLEGLKPINGGAPK